MTDKTLAEQITSLLDQLHDHITTREEILTYRNVVRGKRAVALLETKPHTVRNPGLLKQLGVIASGSDGVVIPGASVPGGSPGWDADGALAPITGGKRPESPEPIAEAWHTADQIRHDLRDLGAELFEQGWRPPDTLITIALKDADAAQLIAARLRSMVSRARIAADYDAPIVTLRDVICPVCGGELKVRKDASSAVWCSGLLPLQGPAAEGGEQPIGMQRCGAHWPQGGWVRLLDAAS